MLSLVGSVSPASPISVQAVPVPLYSYTSPPLGFDVPATRWLFQIARQGTPTAVAGSSKPVVLACAQLDPSQAQTWASAAVPT
jgi:trimethylamine:corrinoid methyltransferase-like protein